MPLRCIDRPREVPGHSCMRGTCSGQPGWATGASGAPECDGRPMATLTTGVVEAPAAALPPIAGVAVGPDDTLTVGP